MGESRRMRSLSLLVIASFVAACSAGGDNAAPPTPLPTASTTSAALAANSGAAGSVTTTTAASTAARVASGKGMVAVAAGSYTVGSDQPGTEAVRTKTVTVTRFNIDVYEVTNAEYRRFVDAEGAISPRGWTRGRVPDGKENHPVVGVDWEWAQAYCISLSKRLPTDAEWESAARGPDARLYPWGNTAGAVDLDTPGSRPVGSAAANVSPAGVHDTVGSAWEWVDEPYDPVPAGNKVRRGGEYGRVRIGAAFRQVVAPTNEAVVVETGFRCAADTVDPSVEAGVFSSKHPRPAAPPTTTIVGVPAAGLSKLLRADSFEDPRSGWIDQSDPKSRSSDYFIGYHAPGWYHVEASQAHVQVMSLAGLSFDDVAVEVKVYVDKTNDVPGGKYRYGIVFRADGPLVKPSAGMTGPDRPRDFYAFAISPRDGSWQLLHADSLPYRVVAQGKLTVPLVVTDATKPDTLRVEARRSDFRFFVNGAEVGRYGAGGLHPSGDVGMFAETIDETKAHVHFDSILVTRLD